MKKITIVCLSFLFFLMFGNLALAQYRFDKSTIYEYRKKETGSGIYYAGGKEREELLTDESRSNLKQTTGTVKLQFNSRSWNYLDFKQELFEINFETGPFRGNGNLTDSSFYQIVNADKNFAGLRSYGSLAYSNRFYYTENNYTIVQINGWSRFDWYRQKLIGSVADSNRVVTPLDKKENDTKFRFGFEARAGWGIGRLNAVNHFMVADYLLNKYYSGRNFSEEEINRFASAIGQVKHQRNKKTGHAAEKEAGQIQSYLNKTMFLSPIKNLEEEWIYGEFLPRLQGSRIEFGPFFKYYNREPDFMYGAYFQFKNAKYCNSNRNRNFSALLEYNKYKRNDWLMGEINLGWSYYIQLKSQLDFGLKYVPGITVYDFDDFGQVNHGLIPYVGYFTQLNENTRVNLAVSLRISNNESILLPGPEFSVGINRSRY